MKLQLYQPIHYQVTSNNLDFTIDFFSPGNTLEYLHSQICSFTGDNYLCQEAAIFGKLKLGAISYTLEKCTAGFSLITDKQHTLPSMFSEKIFHSGSYVFTQFKDTSPEGIREAVNGVSGYIISHNLQPEEDTIILRIVHETGGLLTESLQNFAFQVCVALKQ